MCIRDSFTSMDPWFLNQIKQITDEVKAVAAVDSEAATADDLRTVKRMGVSDERLASEWKLDGADQVRAVSYTHLDVYKRQML